MKHERNRMSVTSLMTLAVFGVFAVCIMMVLLTGARQYRFRTDRSDKDFTHRTAVQYLTTRIRQNDRTGAVSVADFDGYDALHIYETIVGLDYLPRIYCCDGNLRELFCAADGEFSPEDGEVLLPLQNLALTQSDGMVHARFTFEDGTTQEIALYLQSRTEDLP